MESKQGEEEEPKQENPKPSQLPFKYEISSEKSVSIDFAGHEKQDASILLVELPTEDDKVKAPNAEVKVFVSTCIPENNKIEICSFSPQNTEEKNVCFTATAEAEPKIYIEGPGTVIVSGVFAEPYLEDEEEEEEEDEKDEK